jgi:hypothetical protein
MRKNPQMVPPRIGYYTHDFRDGQGIVRIKIVRDSWLCHWLKVPAITFWNRIYVRDKVIVRKRLILELSRIRVQRQQGLWRTVWKMIQSK